jgi:hypothetical protein
MKKVNRKVPLFQRMVGLGSVAIFGCFLAERMAFWSETGQAGQNALGLSMIPLYLAFTVLSLLSAYLRSLVIVQALPLAAMIAIHALSSERPLVCLAFGFGMGFLLLRRGFFVRRAALKAAALVLAFCSVTLGPFALSDRTIVSAMPFLFACGGFGGFIAALATPRLRYALVTERRELLRLEDFGLSERECVLAILKGKRIKEILPDGSAETSTVRNILCGAYKKLGVAGIAELKVLGERYRVV